MMSPDRWAEVKALFDAARAVPADRRALWLDESAADASVRAEVEALLQTYEDDPGFLEEAAPGEQAGAVLLQRLTRGIEGHRIGSYRVVRELGRGGMGVVYEALRDDDGFSRRVAVKVLPPGWSSSSLADRFRFERQVLAGLDHPGIARLYDAGATDDGVPFFVMEFVDGQPVDAWCRERALTVRQAVALMVQVCEAVGHAHQNFVVHRDLKPANILVTVDGHPKLLDFGIAKMVSEEVQASPGLTQTGQYAFTPEYASPEQVRGAAITTASDVYSLGMLLYLVTTGRPAYALTGLGPMDAMRAVCETEPAAPSAVAPQTRSAALRGDLDRIVLKTLRKEPADRYGTVSALIEDLRAWLDGRAVSATPATTWYRLGKALARHKVTAAAAAAVVLALMAGGVATAWQARVAQAERDKAERRFAQVRQFSRALLFDVHDALKRLPGATEPRRLLLDRAVQFLDGLATDAADDSALALELAEAYRRLGQVQGSAQSDNLGNVAAARASFDKAARLCDAVLARAPASKPAMMVATGAYDDLANARLGAADTPGAERAYQRHAEIAARLERAFPNDPVALASVASSCVNLGLFRGRVGDRAGAQQFYQRAIRLFDALPPGKQAEVETLRMHSFALKRSAAITFSEDRLEDAERVYRQALGFDEALVARYPDNPTYRYDMTFCMSDLALIARRRKDLGQARALYLRALQIREQALQADPRNVRAMLGVANLHGYLGAVYRDQGADADAVAHFRKNLELRRRLLGVSDLGPGPAVALLFAQVNLAASLLDLAEHPHPGPSGAPDVIEARRILTEAAGADRALVERTADGKEALAYRAQVQERLRRLGG
jgi:eukaryotic-like serine/threonine-protein kinase